MTHRQISRRRWREYELLAGRDLYTKPWDLPSSVLLDLTFPTEHETQESHGDRT